jgi:hypothetical protein
MWTFGQAANCRISVTPGGEPLVALATEWSDAEWAANMVDDDRYRGKFLCQVQELAELRVI